MRVLQINAVYKTKSTGRITKELHQFFLEHDIDSYVAYGTENTDSSSDSHIFRIGNTLDHKIHAVQYRIDHMQGCHSTFETKRLLKKIGDIQPDIVLTHNLHSNYLNVPVLLRGLNSMGIKIVLDLHDCWFLTGGCYHYTAINCDKWLDKCKGCPLIGKAAEKKYNINCQIFEEVHPTVIATSKWIEKEAKKSLLNGRCDIYMIYDWIDRSSFYPRDTIKIREKLGVKDKKLVLGVATAWGPDKGQDEMIEVAKSLPEAMVVLVGNQSVKAKYPNNIMTIDFTDSKDELAQLYSAADVFFNPSKQETFGLTSGEALACGTPIVVYNTTACPEFVTEYTGVVMEKGTDVVAAVKKMINKNEKYGRDVVRKHCYEFVDENFNREKNIKKYIDLFKHIISN